MKENILVVDDEKEIADLIALYLENEGLSVLKCYTAQEALSHIERDEIDLAILDIVLPEMDGFICKCHACQDCPEFGRIGNIRNPL